MKPKSPKTPKFGSNLPSKKTIYVDVDEEITSIIDKVKSTKENIVALVVPKRASVFLSVVNMKLLKRAADQSNKKTVLITSNASVLPLAGLVGMHVSANLNSQPYVPAAPTSVKKFDGSDEDPIQLDSKSSINSSAENSAVEDSPVIEPKDSTPIQLAGKNKAETIKLADESAASPKIKKSKKPKLKVPNFAKFRLLLIAGFILLIALIAGLYWALAIAPSATVSIKGESSTKGLAFGIKADQAAAEISTANNTVPARLKELKKTETERVPTTGQKDKGNKASGTVTLMNCSNSDGSVDIPAGTGVSSGDLTFITQEAVSLPQALFTFGRSCVSVVKKEVPVIAQTAGDKYNVAAKSYAVAGFSGVTGQGSSMTGGTSQLVKVVSESDIESAKKKLATKQLGATEELKASLIAEGYIPLTDTFVNNGANYVPTPALDNEANDVVVSVQSSYTMLGIQKDGLNKLLSEKIVKDAGVDLTQQSLLSDGLSEATYQLGAVAGKVTDVQIKNTVTVGPQIDKDNVKQLIAGKKRGEAEQLILQRPGIKEVRIETKPFFNYSVPKKVNKINLVVEDTPDAAAKP